MIGHQLIIESRKRNGMRELPWWTSPSGICFGFLLPMLLLIAYVGDSNLPGLTIRGVSFLTGKFILLAAGVLLVSSLCGWIGSQFIVQMKTQTEDDWNRWDRAAMAIGTIALFAYLFFFRDFLFNPLILIKTFMGTYRPDRTNIELTVGVTSLVNFGPVFFSIYAYRVTTSGAAVKASMHLLCVALLCLTAFRVYAWSERLALIESIVPFGLSGAALLSRASGKTTKAITLAGPFIAIPAFILYFGIGESVRSWTSATYHGRSGFWEFAIGRLASYYYTSLNNGAGLLATLEWPRFQFQYTLAWLHRAPLIGPLFSNYVGVNYGQLEQFLNKYGDPEFNNPSGIFSVIFDLGLPLGIIYFAGIGFVGGVLFQAYRSATLSGILLYPLLYITFLEIFRHPYLGAPRAFTWMLGIAVVLLLERGNSVTRLLRRSQRSTA